MTQNIEPLLTTSKVAGRITNSWLDNKMYKYNIKKESLRQTNSISSTQFNEK